MYIQVLFDEGRVVELNNQAKHAVHNNMAERWRIHLIFDYVDEDYTLPVRQILEPGEKINQTRRSIDLGEQSQTSLIKSTL